MYIICYIVGVYEVREEGRIPTIW